MSTTAYCPDGLVKHVWSDGECIRCKAESSCACGFSADMCRAFLAFDPPRKCCANCTHWEVTGLKHTSQP